MYMHMHVCHRDPSLDHKTERQNPERGRDGVLIEVILFFVFLVIAIEVPVLNAQVRLPSKFFPGFLVDLYLWYSREFGDYLFVEKPPFFIGLMWLELLIQWPLSILNLYSICRRKSWFNTTCLVYGLSAFTTTVAILADMIISSKLTNKLMIMYFPFVGFDVLAILHSLLPYFSQTRAVNGTSNLARKKRA
ncbi:sigma intracellular receptor 2-like [Camellia sinensis]|uniref:sigma intracellular receptor 2-like n=1 Tax=Camellia sinensis TaxID=4442 RepID=UPI00103599BD|nr:sigma intracellular receptor 2-like [Camellia sinensis]